jgi:2-oxoglutarate ferredoxin oxidoreductase subunit alpha
MSSEPTILATTQSGAVEKLQRVVIRFAGDSGDGMQVTGDQFTATTALAGNDLATMPDFPAEIRAPAGTLPGVSGFQIQFSSEEVFTPGDRPDVLVAMNPAALKVNLSDLRPNGILIVNTDAFKPTDLKKATYAANPLEDGSLDGYQLFRVELTRLTRAALKELELPTQSVDRCKNFFALGMMYYLYHRPLGVTLGWLEKKFAGKPELIAANQMALKAGHAYCTATELFHSTYEVPPARLEPGTYRNISGNQAMALGFVAASRKSGLPLFQGSYPITPASDLLHELSMYKQFGVVTFQAEDEIAAIGSAIGASFAGSLALCSTSGPGMALKSEFLNLAIMVELPLVVVDIQRAGPSTGMPTKTEQADLLQAIFGRFGESPCLVLAARSPADCFDAAYEACRLSLRHMTPAILLSDGFIANGAEPWRLPRVDELPQIPVRHRTEAAGFQPYLRDAATLARNWAVPGTPGLEHRIGGLEKHDVSGEISYDPHNHEHMVRTRAEKVARAAADIPPAEPEGDEAGGLLVVGWGSTYGAITSAVRRARGQGRRVSHLHLRHLNPMPRNMAEVLSRYDQVLVPEINLGQLALLLQGRYLQPVERLNKVQGLPFRASEIFERVMELTAC